MAAARHAARKRMRQLPTMLLVVVIVAVSLALLALDVMDGYLNIASTAALVLALPAVWIAVIVIVPVQARRQYRQSAQLRDDQTVSFDDEAITFASRRGTVRLPFSEYREYLDRGGLILLYQTEMFYNLVPRHALGDAGDEMLARLQAAGVRRL
ncbi:YcxB family protein [Croceicoccus sp. BE223]|uniref:YcxB family protein n=1 Tax=Croceicoccus sp. BE223 TaxID=2817716 RepID=UPI002863D297|nr:YcxB family protein [Croceicoccus sp. BE223]MDR7102575.1 hypothetical protein [Croceicoccus sp. BE223]